MRDICKPEGGGLQKAVKDRGGISKLRCLHARRDPEVRIEIHFCEQFDDEIPIWKYILGFKHEGKGAQRLLVSEEKVWSKNEMKTILSRPDQSDLQDTPLLTETSLEQTRANADFREIANFLSNTTYLHLVPQLPAKIWR